MNFAGSIGARFCMAIIGALSSGVERVPLLAQPAGASGAASAAIHRKPEDLNLEQILERLAARSREMRSVQVRYTRERVSRAWGDKKNYGPARLVLERGEFGVVDAVESGKPDGEQASGTWLFTCDSSSLVFPTEKIGYKFARERDDSAWLPSELKLSLFFDTTVTEMTRAYRFRLEKSGQKAYSLRVTPKPASTGVTWSSGGLVLNRTTLLPTIFWVHDGHGEYDVYRALDININEPIPDDIRALADGSAWEGWTIEILNPKQWFREWLQLTLVKRGELKRANQ